MFPIGSSRRLCIQTHLNPVRGERNCVAKGTKSTGATHRLSVITVLPPPLTGQTLVSQEICCRFAEMGEFDLQAIRNCRGHVGIGWTLRKHGSILARLVWLAFSGHQRQRAYFVPDAGAGLWFNILEALLMRLAFEKVWFHHHTFSYVRRSDARMRAIHLILGNRLHDVAKWRFWATLLLRRVCQYFARDAP